MKQTETEKELKRELAKIRNELDLVKTALIPTIQKVMTWHTHLMNGDVHWQIPEKYLDQLSKFSEKMPTPQDKFTADLKPSAKAEV